MDASTDPAGPSKPEPFDEDWDTEAAEDTEVRSDPPEPSDRSTGSIRRRSSSARTEASKASLRP
eukprot:8498439-Pyramimonas_sp.AAC.1